MKFIIISQSSYQNLALSYDFLSLKNAIKMLKQTDFSRKFQRILTEVSRTDRLPDNLKWTVIRIERTLLCGNQCRLCHSPFSSPYESRKIFNAERRATNNILTSRRMLIFSKARFKSRWALAARNGSFGSIDYSLEMDELEWRNWINRSEETAQ